MQKRLNRWSCHLGFGIAWAQGIVLDKGSRSPHGKGRQFWWIGSPIVNIDTFCRGLCNNSWTDRFAFCVVDLWAEGCTSLVVFTRWRQCALMGGHIAVTWRIQLNRPSMATMRLISNYFDHFLSVDTPTYTVAQIAERFEPNSVLWAFQTIQLSTPWVNKGCHPNHGYNFVNYGRPM